MNDGSFPPPPPPPPPGSEPPVTKADSLIRLGARIIDGLILLVPTFVFIWVIGGSSSFTNQEFGRAWLASALATVLQFAYFVVLESTQGATPGKRALGMKVLGASGGLPTQEEAMRRNAFMLLSIIPTFLGSLTSLVAAISIAVTIGGDSLGRGWHDNFAGGTRVVRRPK